MSRLPKLNIGLNNANMAVHTCHTEGNERNEKEVGMFEPTVEFRPTGWYYYVRICVHQFRQYTGGVYCAFCGLELRIINDV